MNDKPALSRRDLFAAAGAASLMPAFGAPILKAAPSFRVVHLTDIHVQPELGASDGLKMCVDKVLTLHPRPDFILTGGDHVMDVLQANHARADVQFGIVAERFKPLEMPIHHAVGNHDVFGWTKGSPITASDPAYGKALFEEKVREGKSYYSFDHKGWHFIVLDSIGIQDGNWMGRVDDDQLQWLKNDLAATGPHQNILVNIHMPIITAFVQETEATMGTPNAQTVTSNGKAVFDLLRTRPVKLVMQGHTHVVESVEYLGTKFMTAGSVCGDWWKGPRLGVHPEGFTVLDFHADDVDVKYIPYGWKARSA